MGRVYQFVGDEAVVTWSAKKLKNFKHTVDFFYYYEEELNRKKDYFQKEYGLLPVFTASINSGKVMAAEVGEIKKELAFHGDVLNTAARIQKQCKTYRKKILVTSNFASQLLDAKTGYKLQYVDIVKFIGKNRTVKIYEVYTDNPSPDINSNK
jgi:adenylate cyclase